ncbi:MAG TPA: hypothetical protein VN836_12085 [Verrucomicrobiae bacterium]|nr:hypothetical protein [Verrucomicrobiae bacterium]
MNSTIEEFKSRQEIFEHPTLSAYDKAGLLKQWDTLHKGQPPEVPRLSGTEREWLAECTAKFKALKEAHVKLASNLERYRTQQEKTRLEIKHLEQSLTPDETESIKILIFERARLEILDKFVNKAPAQLRQIEEAVAGYSTQVDHLISKRFGADLRAGGRFFGPASIPARCDLVLATIEKALDQK